MALFTDDNKRNQLIIGALSALACVIYLVVVSILDVTTEIMDWRFVNADDIFNGRPLEMEYPPLMLPFILLPRLFASTPFWYNVGFVVELFIFFIIGLIAVCKLAERFNKDQKRFMLLYTLMMLLMFEFVVDRQDVIPVAITLLAIYLFVSKRYTWAFVLLALGTMIKLYPGVLFIVFLIPLLMERNWKEALKGTAAFAIVSGAVVLFAMLIQPDMLSFFIGYHSDRPLQIESVAASMFYPFVMMGLMDRNFAYTYGSDNFIGPLPDAIAPWLTPLMVVSILMLYVVYVHVLKRIKDKGDENDRMYLFAGVLLLSVMLFIVVGKVMSSQYLMWIIPFLLFMFMFTSDKRWERKMLILFIVILVLVQLQFAVISGYFGGAETLALPENTIIGNIGLMIIVVKNVLLLLMFYYVARSMYERCLSMKRSSPPTG